MPFSAASRWFMINVYEGFIRFIRCLGVLPLARSPAAAAALLLGER